MEYILPENVYAVCKWVGLIFCPALAVLIATIGPAWGLANVEAIVTTINAIGLFIGACIGVSQVTAKPVE